jgi:Fe2+ or Zn2+ uptake regulation protein
VYETVAGTESHPTAEWVYRQVRRDLPRISLGTVYRNLQRLVAEGKLKAWSRGRTTRFDADVTRHDHFVCRACGLMIDLQRSGEALVAEKRLKARGYEIQDRVLEFIGLCRDCRRGRRTHRSEGETSWQR